MRTACIVINVRRIKRVSVPSSVKYGYSRPLQKSALQLWGIGCVNVALVCFPYNLCVEFVECVGYPLGIAED